MKTQLERLFNLLDQLDPKARAGFFIVLILISAMLFGAALKGFAPPVLGALPVLILFFVYTEKRLSPLTKKTKLKFRLMVASVLAIFVLAVMTPGSVFAGSVAGTGGSTEVTQIANNVQLANQYAQQVQGYVRQGLQLEAQMKNLIQNPASLLGQDIGGIINGVGRLYSAGNAIGGNLAMIDRNFANTFKSPTARTLADSFTRWHSTNTDTLEAALKAVGMHRDGFDNDTAALNALHQKSQSAQGNLQALQTVNEFNAMNIQHLQKLEDLIATQSMAASTYMASQTAKDQAVVDLNKNMPMPSRNPRDFFENKPSKY